VQVDLCSTLRSEVMANFVKRWFLVKSVHAQWSET